MDLFNGRTLLELSVLMLFAGVSWAGPKLEKATFAGGCFWCMEPPFRQLKGVVSVVSGYTGGKGADPSYQDYAEKGHVEAVEVTYDPARIAYEKLLDAFWMNVDPTDPGGQFADQGTGYRTMIFYHSPAQKKLADRSKSDLAASRKFQKPVVTDIRPAVKFYPAEDYHQDYAKKNPFRYHLYRAGSGRDKFIKKTWGDAAAKKGDSKMDLKKKLSPMQYEVTQQCGTEPPFQNAYWNEHRKGLYVDIVSGEPLFSSTDKFDSGTGWPSFLRPVAPDTVVEKEDKSLFTSRTEVKSKKAGSHLGHVFKDGPRPTGLRYCINSASLRFIPQEDLEKEGYGKYLKLFGEK